jgi:Domain of unknown function (DUF4159)/Aerotolerance regulator N-terminal
MLDALQFASPLALWGLLSLPVIWWLLRFIPPRPRAQQFPPIRILLGLDPKQETPDKTPWWLLLLRLALAALLVFGVSQPFLSKISGLAPGGTTLVVIDDGWAAAPHWAKIKSQLRGVMDEAQSQSGTVVIATTTPSLAAKDYQPVAPADALTKSNVLQPRALTTDRPALLAKLKNVKPSRIVWLSDGLRADGFAAALTKQFTSASLDVYNPGTVGLPVALAAPSVSAGDIIVKVIRNGMDVRDTATIQLRARNGRVIAEGPAAFKGVVGEAKVSLPVELRNEVQSIVIAGQDHAGARYLVDDRWRRKTVVLQSGANFETAQPLLSPLHFASRAIEPYAEFAEVQNLTELSARFDQGLSMLILADIGVMEPDMQNAVSGWVEKGGMLVRFAGPRLAAATDALVPVKLREGGRDLGSALSWETPQEMQTFPATSPFAGITLDSRIKVARQVLAEPDDLLTQKTWASLADGTPLVTAEKRGKGLLVLFHTTANADWSNLPLTGVFVGMLQRLIDMAPAAGASSGAREASTDAAQAYTPRTTMNGFGELGAPEVDQRPIAVAAFDKAVASAATPTGLYERNTQERAINLALQESDLARMDAVPATARQLGYAPPERLPLAHYAFVAAMILFLLDALAMIFLGGGLARLKRGVVPAALVFLILAPQHDATAQDADAASVDAALETRIAFVKTGNSSIDDTSEAGLKGLGQVMDDRTSADIGEPVGVDLERDEIVFYPLLYWPIDETAAEPSSVVLQRVNAYMKNGGTILFDLRDGGTGTEGTPSEALRRVIGKLDVPPLEVAPEGHVLRRTFYLLKEFPGRYAEGPLWVESTAGGGTSTDPGTADGVSSIIIGTNDYAAAWAMDDRGEPLNALIPGSDLQREYAFRTGVNIVMYSLTGNYKADQVHIPALLERLGQ